MTKLNFLRCQEGFFSLIKKVILLLKVEVVVRQINYSCPREDIRKGLHIQPKQGLIPLLVHLNAVFFWLMFVGPAWVVLLAGNVPAYCNAVCVQNLVLEICLQYHRKGFEIKSVPTHSLKLKLLLRAVEQLPVWNKGLSILVSALPLTSWTGRAVILKQINTMMVLSCFFPSSKQVFCTCQEQKIAGLIPQS